MHLQLSQENFSPLWPMLSDAAVKGAVLMLAATAGALALARSSAARRHLLWVLALVGVLLIPALSALMPGWRLNLGGTDATETAAASAHHDAAARLASLASEPAPGAYALTNVSPSISHLGMPAGSSSGTGDAGGARGAPLITDLRGSLVVLWLVGVAAMLAPILLGALSVWRLGRRSTPVTDDSWLDLLETACRQIGLRRTVTLLRSDDRAMPMTWGILRPTLLIPAEADDWTIQRRRVVVLHELAHIQRHDCVAQVLAQLARAVYWFNPLCWWASRQVTVERELACDDKVLNGGTLPSDYAEQLMAVAVGSRRSWGLLAAVAMARPSKLGERLIAILDPQRRRSGVTRSEAAVLIALLAVLLMPMSMLKPFAAGAAQISGQPGGPAAMAAEMPPLSADTRLLVRIDLKKVSPESLQATAKAVLGEKGDVFDQAIAKYRPICKAMTDHEASTVWFSAGFQPSFAGPVFPVIYIEVAADAEATALESDLKKIMADDGNDATFFREGHFLLIREPVKPHQGLGLIDAAAPRPIVADAQTAKAFAQALSAAGNAEGLTLAVVPDSGMKGMSEQEPKDLPLPVALLFKVVHDADSLTVSVVPGTDPKLTCHVQCADEVRAKSGSETIDQGMKSIARWLQQGGAQEPQGQTKKMADQLNAMKAVVNGNSVELSVDDKALAAIGGGMAPQIVAARENAAAIRSMNNIRQLVLGMFMYADAHQGQWPDKLEDIKQYVEGEDSLKRLLTNPNTGDTAGYVYQKPPGKLSELKDPASTPVIFEAKDGKKIESGLIGYADGHAARAK